MKRLVFALFLTTALLAGALVPSPAKAEEEAKAVIIPEFEYLQLKPLTLPVISDKGMSQQVSLVVSLELPYGKKDEIAVYEPRLADAYLQDLYGSLSSGRAMMRGNIVDVQAVKQRLSDITLKVLGPEKKVNSILLQVVQQRPM